MSEPANSTNSTNSIVQTNNALLSDINNLQEIEKTLVRQLESFAGKPSEQRELINKINSISTMRINLYKSLNSLNTYFKGTMTNSRVALAEQTAAIKIVENEMNQLLFYI